MENVTEFLISIFPLIVCISSILFAIFGVQLVRAKTPEIKAVSFKVFVVCAMIFASYVFLVLGTVMLDDQVNTLRGIFGGACLVNAAILLYVSCSIKVNHFLQSESPD
jgi:hypothetical protein